MQTIDKVIISQYWIIKKTLGEKAFPIAASEDTSTCFLLCQKKWCQFWVHTNKINRFVVETRKWIEFWFTSHVCIIPVMNTDTSQLCAVHYKHYTIITGTEILNYTNKKCAPPCAWYFFTIWELETQGSFGSRILVYSYDFVQDVRLNFWLKISFISETLKIKHDI